MWLKWSPSSKNCFLPYSRLFSSSSRWLELPITRTFFNFPWRFQLSGVDCIQIYFERYATVLMVIFQCNWNTCNVIYSPVVSVVSSKCFINSGNRTPKLRTKPVLRALQIAEEIHTTHDERLSEWCLPRKNQHSFPSISLEFSWTSICAAFDF